MNLQLRQTLFEEKLNNDLDTYTKALKQEKIRKFQRDAMDYKEVKIYNWRKKTPRNTEGVPCLKARPRTVSFNFKSSEC